MTRAVLLTLALVASLTVVGASPATAASQTCTTNAGLQQTSQICQYTHTELVHLVYSSPGTVRYRVAMQCLSDNPDGLCNNPRVCQDPPGTVRYDVLMSTSDGPFLKVGEVCLTAGQAGELDGVITEQMVATAFARLDWPPSPLVVQPPNGRTLVNLDTNFLTTNTQPTSQHVTLLGQDVEIEATPTGWVWHYGDGSDDSTSVPGAAYPDLQITHAYQDAGVTVHPSVDTVYSGRYRIDGGAWQTIDQTRTIPGAPVDLQVLEARPVLVGSDG